MSNMVCVNGVTIQGGKSVAVIDGRVWVDGVEVTDQYPELSAKVKRKKAKAESDAAMADEGLWVFFLLLACGFIGWIAAKLLEAMDAPGWTIVPLILCCAVGLCYFIRKGPPD